jgi:glycerol kinase
VGDQQASLFGQSCVEPGRAKITFGTGAMLDRVTGPAPASSGRLPSGCFPIVARSRDGHLTWGVEGIVLTAGTCVEWLVTDIGLVASASETESVARSVSDTSGVTFVPALLGLGTPRWDFGARGAFFGLTRGAGRAHLVRAVLEGVAHRGADLMDAADDDGTLTSVCVDGGMSANGFLLQRLADVSGREIAVSPEREATTRGAGLMALVGLGGLSLDDVSALWRPAHVYEPVATTDERESARAVWAHAVERAAAAIPELSSVSF